MIRCMISALCVLGMALSATQTVNAEEWKSLMDGKTFKGWKINENPESWSIKDGAFVAKGDRSHLFYVGEDKPFKNFEFQAEVMTKPGANGGIYFHTKYQESGWPKGGFEVQVNNTQRDPKRTGGLYAVKDVFEAPAKDNEWFTMYFKVVDNTIVTKVNDKVLIEYTQPEDAKPGKAFERVFSKGTFALQAHDPGSEVHFKNIKVKRLP